MARKSRKQLEAATVETDCADVVYNVAGYIRLSVEDNKKKGDSVETQKAILENYLALQSDMRLHHFYIDNGTTGTNFDRPQFQKMLCDAENGVINCIVVKDLSRFGRNGIDTGYYIEKYLPSINVRFVAVNDDFDTLRDMANGAGVLLPLKNMINEAYALDIGRKIRAQQNQAMKSGEFVGARPPYGFIKDPDNCHKLLVDPESAEVVKLIFGWAYEKAGLNTIARRLNEMGIEPPNIYAQRKGIIKFRNLRSNRNWQTFVVKRILEEEAYVGDLVQGKTQTISHKQVKTTPDKWITVQNTHEAIISREMFAAVQETRKEVAEKCADREKAAYTPNIFKGKVFCGHCGMPLHRQKCARKKTDDVYIFHCLSNSRKARGSCIPYSMPEGDLTAALLTLIEKHAEAVIGKSLKLRKSGTAEARHIAVKSELTALRQEADKDGRMLKSLYESLVSGIITADEYREMRESYEEKARANLSLAAELERGQKALEKQTVEYCELSDLMENAATNGITAELVDRLIDRIRISSDRSIAVDFHFESGFELIEGMAVNG
jgi:DNA invertase Pin-like site-specific DNA recombinase